MMTECSTYVTLYLTCVCDSLRIYVKKSVKAEVNLSEIMKFSCYQNY